MNGKVFFFNNQDFQEGIENDDIREATVFFEEHKQSWATGFKIVFNGALLHSSKTFASMEKRLNKLITKWNLIEGNEL